MLPVMELTNSFTTFESTQSNEFKKFIRSWLLSRFYVHQVCLSYFRLSFIRRRQAKIMQSAIQIDAIVLSSFPVDVRERVVLIGLYDQLSRDAAE
jgi:hypothetical protein